VIFSHYVLSPLAIIFQNESLSTDLSVHRDTLRRLQTTASSAERQQQQLSQTLAVTQQNMDSLQRDVDALKTQLATSQARAQQAELEAERLRNEAQTLRSRGDTSSEQQQRLATALATATDERAYFEREVGRVTESLQSQLDQYAQLEGQLRDLQSRYEESEASLQVALREKRELQEEGFQATAQLRQAQSDYQAALRDIARLKVCFNEFSALKFSSTNTTIFESWFLHHLMLML
jgi:chromosome segregation ATPase